MTTPRVHLADGRSRSGGVKLIIVLVLALAVGAGAGWAVWGRSQADPKRGRDAGREAKEDKNKDKREKAESKHGEAEPELIYVNMGPFLVNVAAAAEKLRYIQVEITLGVHTPEEEGKKKKEKGGHGGGHGGGKPEEPKLSPASDALARDAIVRVLSAQSFAELQDTASRDKLRVELHKELGTVVKDIEVRAVLFTSFLMQ